MDLEPNNLLDEKSIRSALRNWRSLKLLGQNTLTGLNLVEARRVEAGLAANSAGRGIALQKALQIAVEMLRPDDGSPNPKDRRWRAYIILTEQFLHSHSPEAVRGQLFLSKGAYFSEQKKALETLLAVLQAQEMKAAQQFETPIDRLQSSSPFIVPPRPDRCLIGRESELQGIKSFLLRTAGGDDVALRGLPGVGKTSLAVELAHDPEIRRRFEDGILWAGLGYRPPSLLSLLGAWAEALGIPPHIIAGRTDLRERAALLHAQIGERRMLFVIDDAWQVEAALALKVGGPNCAHLVTTRLPEVALSFAPTAVIQIHELNPQAGLILLEEISPSAVAADRDQARNLVTAVGGLPLALILAGNYLRKQSHSLQPRRVRDAIQKLQTGAARLQLNQIDPPLESNPNFPYSTPVSLQAIIGLSDAALPPAAHQALLDLAAFPPKPNSFSEEAALAVTAAPPEILDALVDGGLLETAAPGRYTLHQTITDYAALQGDQTTACQRLAAYYHALLGAHVHDFGLLDQESANIFAALELAVQHHQDIALMEMILALYLFLETHGLYSLAEHYLQNAFAVSQARHDPYRQAMILSKLGDSEVRRGRFQAAQELLEQSLALARETDNRRLEAEILFNLGLACAYRGKVLIGKQYLEQCIDIYQTLGDPKFEVYAQNALCFCLQELGCYAEAKSLLETSLGRAIELGERRTEGWNHYNLGNVCFSLGEYQQAQDHNKQCMHIYREIGDRRGEGWIMLEIARAFRQTGDYRQAKDLFSQALQILSSLGDTMGQGYSILNLGLIAMDLGDPAEADRLYRAAEERFIQIECRPGESQMYHFRAILCRRNGDYLGARDLLEKSIEIYRMIPYRRGECTHLAHLALIESFLGNADKALGLAAQALRIAEDMQAAPTHAYVLTYLGRILADAGDYPPAENAYRQALATLQQLGQQHITAELLAELAEIAFRQGRQAKARCLVDEAIDLLNWRANRPAVAGSPLRMEWPGRTFLTCVQILTANQDARAETVLRYAREILQSWAARIADPTQRSLFLALPEHQQLGL